MTTLRSEPRPRSTVAEPVRRLLDRVSVIEPDAAERATIVLAEVLGTLGASAWPEVAWRFSRLTNTGLPVEFAWSSRDAGLRWTSEVGAPEQPEADRLARAADITGLDVPPCWRLAQQGGELRYGAWLGVRHRCDNDVAKVYAELPTGLPAMVAAVHPSLRHGDIDWRMAGLSGDGTVETYGRVERVDAGWLDRLERCTLGTTGRLAALARRLAGGDPIHGPIPRRSSVSVVLTPDHRIAALTWFTVAKPLFRNDAAARRRISDLGHELGAGAEERALYAALADQPADGRWQHTMIGVGITADGRSWVQTGIRPA